MSIFYFILSFWKKLEVETNHCDGWPSKGIPLKMKVVVKKDINREMQGEMGKDNNRN
jgi:hypothetical protein